jgi:hypothetical protein
LSTRSIVKKNRRKPQTSQDKAVATNYHSRQTSGKNQNPEYFDVFFGPPSPRLWRAKGNMVQRKLLLRNSKAPFKLKTERQLFGNGAGQKMRVAQKRTCA